MKYVLPGQDSVSRILAFFVVKNKSNSMHKSRKKKEEHELKQWTQEDIREAIESFYAQHHRYPRAGECKSKNGLPTYNTIRAVFQMTAADYLKTFFSQTPREFWTKESVLQAIYQFIQEKGAFPMSKDYCSQNGLPASATVYKLFPGETLRNIYMQYFPEQIQGNYQMQSWTKESIIQALDEYLKRTGQLPGCRDFYRKNHLPTMYSIRKVFGHNIFSPFAALTGHAAAIQETARLTDQRMELDEDTRAMLDLKQQILADRIAERPEVSVVWFRPDEKKDGGQYVTTVGQLKKVDDIERVLRLADDTTIPLNDVLELQSDCFRGIFQDR